MRQKDGEFEASLDYIARLSQKQTNRQKTHRRKPRDSPGLSI
jgi:hypothetical protein